MEIEQAIDRMRHRIDTASDIAGKGVDGKAYEDMEMAISALVKQIPKKPLPALDKQKIVGYKHRCPKCGCAVGYTEKKPFRKRVLIEKAAQYCCICGQAIDWSE